MPILYCDLDNTLVDRAAGYRAWAEQFVAEAGGGPAEVDLLVELDADGTAKRKRIFEEVRSRWGLSEPVDALINRYRQEYPPNLPRVSTEVAVRLEELRRNGWRVAVVSNGPDTQKIKLDICGLNSLVDAVVISDELGVAKPDPRIFDTARRLCGEVSGGEWLIGDSPDADISAAAAMGIPSIWLRRGRRWTEPRWHPYAMADSIEEALALLTVDRGPL